MTSLDLNNFYVTLLSNSSREIYDMNTHADFTVKLAESIHQGTTSKWEVGLCEISCSSSPEGASSVLLYCNLISPQILGDSTVRCIRMFSALPQRHVPARVSERVIRAGGATQIPGHSNGISHDRRSAHPLRGQHHAHESSAIFPQELPVVEIYIKHCVGCRNRTFITMHPLETY